MGVQFFMLQLFSVKKPITKNEEEFIMAGFLDVDFI